MSSSIIEVRASQKPNLHSNASVPRSEDKEGICLPLNPEGNLDSSSRARLRIRLLIKTENKQPSKKNPCLANMETTWRHIAVYGCHEILIWTPSNAELTRTLSPSFTSLKRHKTASPAGSRSNREEPWAPKSQMTVLQNLGIQIKINVRKSDYRRKTPLELLTDPTMIQSFDKQAS